MLTVSSVQAAEIPGESHPLNSTEEQDVPAGTDFCYIDTPAVDRALLTTARKLIYNAKP